MSDTINFGIDFSDFERAADELNAELRQVPFALARAMNDAVEKARSTLIDETWPESINERNHSFLNASLTTSGHRATKQNLSVMLYDKLGRGHLEMHADSGVRTPKGSKIAVPSRAIRRTGKGSIVKSQTPRAIPKSFIKGDIIYSQSGSYIKSGSRKEKGQDNRKLTLMYVLRTSTQIKKDVPLREVFEDVFTSELGKAFHVRLDQAMKSRRK